MRYSFSILFVAIMTIVLFSCKKDEVVNTDYCILGDLWTFEIYDSVSPIHSMDSFKFQQGAGFHTYYWTSGSQNSISFQVKKVTNDTVVIHYNSELIHSLNGMYRGKPFTYFATGTDTIAKIAFKTDKYILDLGPISVNYDGGFKTLKACKLEMTDVKP